eukprot:624004-Amphidinium_carterae.1
MVTPPCHMQQLSDSKWALQAGSTAYMLSASACRHRRQKQIAAAKAKSKTESTETSAAFNKELADMTQSYLSTSSRVGPTRSL